MLLLPKGVVGHPRRFRRADAITTAAVHLHRCARITARKRHEISVCLENVAGARSEVDEPVGQERPVTDCAVRDAGPTSYPKASYNFAAFNYQCR